MTIERDGKVYKLTEMELFEAWREGKRLSDIEELDYWLDSMINDEEIDEDVATKVNLEDYVEEYRRKLNNYDYVNELINNFTMDFVREVICK